MAAVQQPPVEATVEATERTALLGRAAQALQPSQSSHHILAAKALSIGFAHIVSSTALIFFNKYVLSPERFPFAVALTSTHMLTGFLMTSGLFAVCPAMFPSADKSLWDSIYNLRIPVPGQGLNPYEFSGIAVLFASSVVTANMAYEFASVSFLQMVKEATVMWVYIMSVLFCVEKFEAKNFLILLAVTMCAILAVFGTPHFLMLGLGLQIASSVCQATQAAWTGRMMQSAGQRVDPLTMVMCTAPLAFIALLPVNAVFWKPDIMERFQANWWLVLLSALGGFTVQVVNAVTIRELSATGLALAATLKDLFIVFGAALVLKDDLHLVQIVGFLGATGLIFFYSMMKLAAKKAAEEPSSPQVKEKADQP